MTSEQLLHSEREVDTSDPPGRDIIAELKDMIDAETAHGSFVASEVAEHIVEKLRAQDPALLQAFLDEQAVAAVTRLILNLHTLRKAAAKRGVQRRTGRSVFAETLDAHDSGDTAALAGWLGTVVEADAGRMIHLRDCRKGDLEYAASRYAQREKSNRFERMFLEAIAKKIGTKTVGEFFTDEQLTQMRESLTSS